MPACVLRTALSIRRRRAGLLLRFDALAVAPPAGAQETQRGGRSYRGEPDLAPWAAWTRAHSSMLQS
eukprot:SAG31_NODE_20167_length_582_cov_0.587992_2_plen_66_part_01